ncbi:MAG: type II secretion system protein [Patescibacteria group bacterium]|jgi:prepilin-type N-terminal cleavage/methylation domain-containing protein|nr:type II secretion system protein [Patescibacteria group bacterium]
MKNTKTKGFTLLEILLVVAAIAILAGIVILAINPTKQLGDTKNAARRADVSTILNSIYQYSIDNNGSLPNDLTATTNTEICHSDATATTSCVFLGDLTPTYITAIPVDPDENGTELTGYSIEVLPSGRIKVSALNTYPDAADDISATK